MVPGLRHSAVAACALIYNGMAFAFQLPVGAFADRLGLTTVLSAIGCFLIALGGLIPSPVLMCILIGLGNACFHAGGGREVLAQGGKRAGPVGVFVAPGALGIFLGPKFAALGWNLPPLLALCMAVSGLALCFRRKSAPPAPVPAALPGALRKAAVILCFFLTVLLRSYMGTVLCYDAMNSPAFAAAFTGGIFFGKFLGGTLSDRWGTFRFCLSAQVLGTLLFPLSLSYPLLALPAIFLLNTTMAVTASKLYLCCPDYPGTMFGLTTFALYLGGIPRLLGWENICFTAGGLLVLCILSACFLLAGLSFHREEQYD